MAEAYESSSHALRPPVARLAGVTGRPCRAQPQPNGAERCRRGERRCDRQLLGRSKRPSAGTITVAGMASATSYSFSSPERRPAQAGARSAPPPPTAAAGSRVAGSSRCPVSRPRRCERPTARSLRVGRLRAAGTAAIRGHGDRVQGPGPAARERCSRAREGGATAAARMPNALAAQGLDGSYRSTSVTRPAN